MIVSKTIQSSIAVLAAVASLGIAAAQAHGSAFADKAGYLIDGRGNVVKNDYGQCWRTGYWTPAMAIAECDPDLVPKAPSPVPVVEGPEKPAFPKVTLQAETLFAFDKAVLRSQGKNTLDDFVAKMKAHPNVKLLLVTGYADRIGAASYNLKLSQRRAAAVKGYLVNQGVAADRIQTTGMGEASPVVACKGVRGKNLVQCLQPNRRVVVEIKMQRPTSY
ncbi:MAG TPA: hypothetical protein DEP05_08775 [Betaproteobacteria bacterium]|nr:hypothetical protein [Betaproteobacteria bacterium]